MSGDIEAFGAAITAGLAGRAIEPGHGDAFREPGLDGGGRLAEGLADLSGPIDACAGPW